METTRVTLIAREALAAGATGAAPVNRERRRADPDPLAVLHARGRRDLDARAQLRRRPGRARPRRRGRSARCPNHPQGVIHDGYRGRLVRAAATRRVPRIVGLGAARSPEKTTRDRLAFYGTLHRAWRAPGDRLPRRPDVVLASSPPLPGRRWPGRVAARRHRVPWVLDVRDLWPEAAVAVGELGSERAVRVAERLERFLYRDATAITTVTQPFVEHIAASSGGAGEDRARPERDDAVLDRRRGARARPRALGLPADEFVWTFAGNIGLAQGLDTAIDAAALLGPSTSSCCSGDGAARPALEERAARDRRRAASSSATRCRASAPRSSCAPQTRCWSRSRADPVLESFVPSKLFDFCALGRPVLVAANGEPQRMVEGRRRRHACESRRRAGTRCGSPHATPASRFGCTDRPGWSQTRRCTPS